MKLLKSLIISLLSYYNKIVSVIARKTGYVPYIFTKRKFFTYIFVKKNLIISGETNNPSIRWEDINPETQRKFLLDNKSKLISKHIDEIEKIEFIYEKKLINKFIKKAKKEFNFYYGETDKYLFQCLKKFSLENKDVAIMGSTVPWYESIVLANNGRPFTFEYNEIQTNDSRLQTYSFEEFDKQIRKFDMVISISSFEHDGLGRYGDPLNPYGDFEAMKKVRESLLNKEGILILSVPIGIDSIAFNAHRIYGRTRFFKLIEGFEIVDTFGFDESQFTRYKDSGNISSKKDSEWPFQPIIVLKIN